MPDRLELAFHDAMVDVYHRAKDEAGYNATRFIQMVGERGGVETARLLIDSETPSDGYTELWKRGRLDISVEAVVIDDPRWHALFTRPQLKKARARLLEYGYEPRG